MFTIYLEWIFFDNCAFFLMSALAHSSTESEKLEKLENLIFEFPKKQKKIISKKIFLLPF